MFKQLLAVAGLLLLLACASKPSGSGKQYPLNGVWKPVSLEMNATALPPASFAQQQLTLQDTSYTFVAESTDKGAAYYKDGKMDLYGRDGVNAGKHFMCIYKWEGEQLRICYNLAGNGYPGEFSTKGKPTYFMAVFQRIPKP